MRKFLEHLIHYQCSRCITNIPKHKTQDKTGGRHSHNGEFLRLIRGVPCNSDTMLNAYHAWRDLPNLSPIATEGVKGECKQILANATRSKNIPEPRDAEERAIRLIIDHWDQTWIRHGGENLRYVQYEPQQPFPPLKSRYWVGEAVMNKTSEWFAVDLDCTPFRAFEEHQVELRLGPPWVYIVGLVPERIFQRYSGELLHPKDRDHLYARAQIPTKHWVFLYRDTDEHCEKPDEIHHNMHYLKTSGVPRIHWDDYRLLVRAVQNWRDQYAVRKYIK